MKKGYVKTYAKLVVIVSIIIALTYGTVCFLQKEYYDEQFETVKTDMLLINAKTKIIAEKIKMKEKDTNYIGKKLEEECDDNIKFLQEKGVINLQEKDAIYYILEKKHLEELGLPTIKLEQGYYIVEYNQNEVIYSNGIEDRNGNMLYKLTDIEKVDENN